MLGQTILQHGLFSPLRIVRNLCAITRAGNGIGRRGVAAKVARTAVEAVHTVGEGTVHAIRGPRDWGSYEIASSRRGRARRIGLVPLPNAGPVATRIRTCGQRSLIVHDPAQKAWIEGGEGRDGRVLRSWPWCGARNVQNVVTWRLRGWWLRDWSLVPKDPTKQRP